MTGSVTWCNYFHVASYGGLNTTVTITLFRNKLTGDQALESKTYSARQGSAQRQCWPGHTASDTNHYQDAKGTDGVTLYSDGTVDGS